MQKFTVNFSLIHRVQSAFFLAAKPSVNPHALTIARRTADPCVKNPPSGLEEGASGPFLAFPVLFL